MTALAVDPIEKKPLFHFRPGSRVLSVGFAGCNLRCPFCQNWRISLPPPAAAAGPGVGMSPAELVAAAERDGGRAIAYTYSEPLVHAEFLLDCMSLARGRGVANVLVTNGCAGAEAAAEVLALTDAVNIDLKCFSVETYSRLLAGDPSLGGVLEAVLAFARLARGKGAHVEITTLVVPGLNDSDAELGACADFVASLGGGLTPWHLSAYRPARVWGAPPTDPAFLLRARERAGAKLRFVYAGNIPAAENDTRCHLCGALLVRRGGGGVDAAGLARPRGGGGFFLCAGCGGETGIVC